LRRPASKRRLSARCRRGSRSRSERARRGAVLAAMRAA
jgi:hypothetical protein